MRPYDSPPAIGMAFRPYEDRHASPAAGGRHQAGHYTATNDRQLRKLYLLRLNIFH